MRSQPNFQAMAELRYQIRRFLRFSEDAARQVGLEPQQQQLLLAVKGLPQHVNPTIGALAERMQLQPHSIVGLVDRLVDRGFLLRLRATDDRRRVLVKLTRSGEQCLGSLAIYHLNELQSAGPRFVDVLQTLVNRAFVTARRSNKSRHPIALNKNSRRNGKDGQSKRICRDTARR